MRLFSLILICLCQGVWATDNFPFPSNKYDISITLVTDEQQPSESLPNIAVFPNQIIKPDSDSWTAMRKDSFSAIVDKNAKSFTSQMPFGQYAHDYEGDYVYVGVSNGYSYYLCQGINSSAPLALQLQNKKHYVVKLTNVGKRQPYDNYYKCSVVSE
ncbi:hypothetical protein [Cysteiniphilum litorale]|uniref:hypothetical protein n=1 Tax=Cysteiniphilum litorale TaxID=2056700 RepID=UPI003F88584B